ncbi:hypothetical protein ACLOJK_025386 [Asimina triloba]
MSALNAVHRRSIEFRCSTFLDWGRQPATSSLQAAASSSPATAQAMTIDGLRQTEARGGRAADGGTGWTSGEQLSKTHLRPATSSLQAAASSSPAMAQADGVVTTILPDSSGLRPRQDRSDDTAR